MTICDLHKELAGQKQNTVLQWRSCLLSPPISPFSPFFPFPLFPFPFFPVGKALSERKEEKHGRMSQCPDIVRGFPLLGLFVWTNKDVKGLSQLMPPSPNDTGMGNPHSRDARLGRLPTIERKDGKHYLRNHGQVWSHSFHTFHLVVSIRIVGPQSLRALSSKLVTLLPSHHPHIHEIHEVDR